LGIFPLLLLGISSLILLYLYFYIKNVNFYKKFLDLNPHLPITALSFDPLIFLRMMRVNFADSYYTRFFHLKSKSKVVFYSNFLRPSLLIMDHQLAKDILRDYNSYHKKFIFKSGLTDFMGSENLSRVNGNDWKQQRTLINPIFGKLSGFFGLMEKKVDQVIDLWSKISLEGTVNVGEPIQKMTLDVLGICIFGKDFNFFDGSEKGPLHHYNRIFRTATNNRFLALMPTWMFNTFPFGKVGMMKESFSVVNDYIKSLELEALDNKDDKLSLLKMLVEANTENKLSKQAIRDNILIFFIAGHETTATVLQYVLYYLALNPHLQEKLREEVKRVFPGDINPEGLKDLTFTLNVVNEALRLHPPVPVLSRRTSEDIKLGDYNIPKETSIDIFNYGIQRDNDIWGEDANEFNPDRFDHLTKDQAIALMPFGGGPRICIGNTFSLYEQKIFLAKLFRKFKVSLEPGSKLVYSGLLSSPKNEFLNYKFEHI